MCNWLRKEIVGISKAQILVPDYTLGEHDTLVENAVVPLWLRKVFTKFAQLADKVDTEVMALLEAHGIVVLGGLLDQNIIFQLLPKADALRISGIATRASALQDAFSANIMGMYDLWHYPAVGITSDWHVFYRTPEQEAAQTEDETRKAQEAELDLTDEFLQDGNDSDPFNFPFTNPNLN